MLLAWVESNPPGMGIGWAPYPTSVRIVNWIKWVLGGETLPDPCLHSLAIQTRWLSKHLETHLLGNHLFANAKALVFAGLFFSGQEAEGWLDTGLRVLAEEVPEQILADGAHFERSTMYHALAVEDMLDLCNVAACYRLSVQGDRRSQAQDWARRAPAMMTWLNSMCHPDGEIAFFNDAAIGMAPAPDELNAYAQRLGLGSPDLAFPGSLWMHASGYARLVSSSAVALVDLAPIGPDYLPGHAHADTLSFELSVHGERFLVNSGTSSYQDVAARRQQRATAAHNTVEVEGKDSSEVWGSFRVGRRARIRHAEVILTGAMSSARGIHDGYRHLETAHERTISLNENCCTVEDLLDNKHVSGVARFHFAPDVRITPLADGAGGTAMLPNGRVIRWEIAIGEAWIEPATWHPRFGVSVANMCLCVRLDEGRAKSHWNWN